MDFKFKKVFHDYKKNIINFSLIIFFIVNFYKIYFYNFQFWNTIGGFVFYLIFLDILNNGSYLFLNKFDEKSTDVVYFIRFLYLVLISSLSVYCILKG